MSKSSTAITLLRILVSGTIIASGGYLVAQSILNKDSDNIYIGPFTLTFRVDTEGDQVTKQVCSDNSSSTVFSCNDQYITAYYKDNYQTLADKFPQAGEASGFPKLEGYHIQWDIDNLSLVTSNLIVKGRYVENSVSHSVVFKTDYDTYIGSLLVEDTKGPNENEMADINDLAKTVYEKTGYAFAHWDVRYANRFDENGDPLVANLHYVNDDVIATAVYSPRFVEVNFLDMDGSTVLATKEVRFGSAMGEIPTSIFDKVGEYQSRKDAYYYLGKVRSEGGVVEVDQTVNISPETIVTTTSNAESYNIQIVSRNYVTVTFVSSYGGQTKTDVRTFSYTEGHKLNQADFDSIDAISHNGIDISWPVDTYIGTVVDRDIVINASYNIKKVNISYEAYVAEFNTTSYSKTSGILPDVTDSINYGSTLNRSLNASSLSEYSFDYFLVGDDTETKYNEAELSLLTFSEDTLIHGYFSHRNAKVTFKNATNSSGSSAVIDTYIGAPNITFNGFIINTPEGKIFTEKWNYSYVQTVNGVTSTVHKVYNSNLNANETITVAQSNIVLTPIFEDITFKVEFRLEGVGVVRTFNQVIYGTTDLAKNVPNPNLKPNEIFRGWYYDFASSTGVDPSYTPTVDRIIANNGCTIVFVAKIDTQETYIDFYANSSKVHTIVNNGSSTFTDYISQYMSMTGYDAPTLEGYTFVEWGVPAGCELGEIPSIQLDHQIVARFTGNEYDVNYTLVYTDSNGSKVSTGLSGTNDRVQVGKSYQPNMDEIKEKVFNVFDYGMGYSSNSFELISEFNTMPDYNGASFIAGTTVTYNPDFIDDDGKFNLYIQVVPKTININYYAAVDGSMATLGTRYTYTVTSNKGTGYSLLWRQNFNFDEISYSFDTLYDFGGWVINGTTYKSEGDYVPDIEITGDLNCYAIILEKKVNINLYALTNFNDKTLFNNNSYEHTYLPGFNQNYAKLYSSSAVDRGEGIDLSSKQMDLTTSILSYVNKMRIDNGQQEVADNIDDATFTVGGITYKVKGYRLLGGYSADAPTNALSNLWGLHTDLNETLNLILDLETI